MKKFLAVLAGFAALAVVSGCATIRSASDVEPVAVKAAAGDDSSIEALVGALRSGDREVRGAAYSALTSAGAPVVPRLIIALGDEDAEIREYAAGALGNIGDDRAVGPLMDMLENADEKRYVAAWALGEIRAEAATGMLVEAIGEQNEALQKEATRALIKIGAPAVPALIDALESPSGDRRKYAARALGVMQDQRAEEPLIKRLSDSSHDVTAAAALALGTAGTKAATAPLVAALYSGHVTTRVNAAIALGQLDTKDAVGPLEKIMDTDEDPYVREWSARALENITGNRYKYRDENGDMVYPYNLYR